jgi:predicted enzyme related to lactoylglutathione lyase
MEPQLSHVIVFVADMDRSIAYYRDTLGLGLRFGSGGWSEFETGGTTLALHPADEGSPPGTVQVGLTVDDVRRYCGDVAGRGANVSTPPTETAHGLLAQLLAPDGNSVGVSAPPAPRSDGSQH